MDNNPKPLGKRTQQESLRTRRLILDVAESLFARQGYAGVSIREIGRSAGVYHHTIRHHYGSKHDLYIAVLGRWDQELKDRLLIAIGNETDLATVVVSVLEVLFDFMLKRRDWVILTTKARIGVDQPGERKAAAPSWLQFMELIIRERQLTSLHFDLGLLMITIEGILNNHILAQDHYRILYGKDLKNRALRHKTMEHLKKVVLAIVNA